LEKFLLCGRREKSSKRDRETGQKIQMVKSNRVTSGENEVGLPSKKKGPNPKKKL